MFDPDELIASVWSAHVAAQNGRLLLTGAGAAALTVALLGWLRHRPRWMAGWVAPVVALFAIGWLQWPEAAAGTRIAVTLGVGLLAGAGVDRRSVPASVRVLALLAAAGGVWLAVPENSPITAVIGVVLGLVVVGGVVDRGGGYGLALAVAWTALLGARSTGYSFDGGLLCLSPLAALPVVDALRRGRGWLAPWPWFVAGASGLAFAAARWVGVAPDATGVRIAVVAGGAALVAAVVRR